MGEWVVVATAELTGGVEEKGRLEWGWVGSVVVMVPRAAAVVVPEVSEEAVVAVAVAVAVAAAAAAEATGVALVARAAEGAGLD